MRRLLSFLFVFGLVILASRLAAPPAPRAETANAAQAAPGCEGQWLLQLTFEGRDVIEEAIAVFASDGSIVLHTPPVVPPLPGTSDEPLLTSDTVGSWGPGSGVHCTFDVVRLLSAEDGAALGAVNLRGGIVLDLNGLGLEGFFTYDQSSGPGRTIASGSGTMVGTIISE